MNTKPVRQRQRQRQIMPYLRILFFRCRRQGRQPIWKKKPGTSQKITQIRAKIHKDFHTHYTFFFIRTSKCIYCIQCAENTHTCAQTSLKQTMTMPVLRWLGNTKMRGGKASAQSTLVPSAIRNRDSLMSMAAADSSAPYCSTPALTKASIYNNG